MEGGNSFLGNVLGDWFDDFTTTTGIADVAGGVNDFFQTDLGKAIKLASLASNVYSLATAPVVDPNAVGGVTGPDNIDVGGGFNPAAGATAAGSTTGGATGASTLYGAAASAALGARPNNRFKNSNIVIS
jgi:hypothetical protein